MKRILLEVNHPGQVHLFKYIYSELISRGNKVWVITKNNYSIEYLLQFYSIPYQIIGSKKDGLFQKALLQLIHNFNAFRLVRNNNIEVGIGSSITNDHVSFLTKMKAIHFSDDDEEIVPFITKYSYPFSNTIIAPDSLSFIEFAHKNIPYAGTHELAYLHPNRFKPNPEVLKNIGVKKEEVFFVLRFVALKGHHDGGHAGISLEQKRELIKYLSPKGKIFITSEKPIEFEFEQYRLPVPPEEIHSLLYYATMFLGDSQTMTSEAAVLGTPALKCNTFAGKLSVPNDLEENYGLCYSFLPIDFDKFLNKTKELLQKPDLNEVWKKKKDKFISEKIDVTAFMVWFVENYPESAKIMKENPDYQNRFK